MAHFIVFMQNNDGRFYSNRDTIGRTTGCPDFFADRKPIITKAYHIRRFQSLAFLHISTHCDEK
jgi:hypothetical protein